MLPHVLVVEDSPTQAQATCHVLEAAGYDTDIAQSGETALALFDAERVDVVLSDVVMAGGMDGYELCRRIKRTERGRTMPVVLVTSLSSPMDIIHGLEAGADSFISKPYDNAGLVARIGVLLRTREMRAGRAPGSGVGVCFMGHTLTITSTREQILDLLLGTFEDAVRQNQVLRSHDDQLRTARQELATYARSLEARLESILQSVPDVLFSMSADLSGMSYVSAAATRVTGFSPAEFMADPGLWQRRVEPDDVVAVVEALRRARRGETVTARVRMKHRDGTTRTLDVTVVPARNEHDGIERLDGIARDVTEAVQFQSQLHQAQRMELVGQLAGGVAHDFNNLLCVILGWAEMALHDLPTDHALREPLEEIRIAGETATSLTRQLLAFSRKQVVQPSLVDANEVIASMDKMFRRLIGEQILLVTRAEPGIGTVKVDRGQLEQVLMNLVVNARDAMPGRGTITIETGTATLEDTSVSIGVNLKPGEYVTIAVGDNGTGMSDAVKARIFEPFFTTKERDKGTGLGLATCYGILKQAEGYIGVQSEEGAGTTMTVYLPRCLEAANTVARNGTVAAHGAESILLVEDEEAVRRVATRMLETHGYRVANAGTGEEAFRMIESGPEAYDLLLTDVVLPGDMQGSELVESVRALRPDQKVVFASGYTGDVGALQGLLDQGVVLVHKPFTGDALCQRVRDVLDAR